ncbi:MAG: hypothetical protein JWM99_2000 [Verrucomicrobiales bacterium]|nr:hypothetical protein [Verrucomicrobiales bacterium]
MAWFKEGNPVVVEALPSVILLNREGFVIERDLRGERLKSLVEQAFGL